MAGGLFFHEGLGFGVLGMGVEVFAGKGFAGSGSEFGLEFHRLL